MNQPLTPYGFDGIGTYVIRERACKPDHLQKAKIENHGLGLFVRSLVGLDRGAARKRP